jgi:hypothetical protein
MGWWTRDNGDIIGDLPVDRILQAMRAIAERSTGKPTLPAMLSIAAAAIARRPDALVSDPANVPKSSVARVLLHDGKRFDGDRSPPDTEAVNTLWDQFEHIAADYLSTELKRRPTLSELLASLAFVLRVEGTKYLQGVSHEIDIDRITLEPKPD